MKTPDLRSKLSHHFTYPNGGYRDGISPALIQELFDQKLYKLFLPEQLGGLGLSIHDTLKVLRDAAYLNGSLGWLLQIGNGGMYFAANFEEALSAELFKPANTLIAGSGNIGGNAEETEGGVYLSGSWKHCSGADYATLFTVTFLRKDGQICAAILPRNQVEVIPDWHAIGLKQTSTHTIKLEHVFIPKVHLFNVLQRKSLLNEPVFNLPFLVYAQAFFSSVALGITERLIEEARQLMNGKQNPSPNALILIEQGQELWEKAIVTNDAYMTRLTAGPVDAETEQNMQESYKSMIKQLRNQMHHLHAAVGMSGLYASHPFSIFYLDLLAATQHKLLQ